MTSNTRPPPPGLSWAHPEIPLFGAPLPVADGVYWLRMPLPFALDHINLWLLDDGEGWTLVDTGAAASVTRACWETMLAENVLGRPVRRLVVTHFHPDHIGLARWLAERFDCEVCMSSLSFDQAREELLPRLQPESREILDFCRMHGVAHASEFGFFHTGGLYRQVVDGLPQSWTELHDGGSLQIGDHAWTQVLLGGHAEGHLVLHCQELNVLISGDQVLPTITSNVSKFMEPGPALDPLGNYLASFSALEQLPEDVLVLPSHGRVFRGLQARIEQLRRHHAHTLEYAESLCRVPRTAGSLVPDLFPKADSGLHYLLGFGETRAHLVHLREMGRVREKVEAGRVLYSS